MKMAFRFFCSLAVAAAAGFTSGAVAAPGDLDPSFGTGGVVRTAFSPGGAVLEALAVQGDKIIAAGTTPPGGATAGFAVVRYNADGTLDAGFGSGGRAASPPNGLRALGAAVQNDGKIVVAGAVTSGTREAIGIVRYNQNGTIDSAFGGTGLIIGGVPGETSSYAAAVAVRFDGRIVVAGATFTAAGQADTLIYRFLSDGSLDTTLNESGQLLIPGHAPVALVNEFDGTLYVAGTHFTKTVNSFWLTKLLPSGLVDPSFGNVTTPFPGYSTEAHSMTPYGDGRIVIAGSARKPGQTTESFAAARYNPDGTLDPLFNMTGQVVLNPTHVSNAGRAVAVQSDGRTLLAGGASGTLNNVPLNKTVLVRLLPNGQYDTSFNNTGIVTTQIGRTSSANAMVLQNDGLIVTGGVAEDTGIQDFALARYIDNNIAPELSVEFQNAPLQPNAVVILGTAVAGTTAPQEKSFTIRNAGTEDLTGVSVSVAGAGAGKISLTSPPAATVSGGGTTTFTLRFTPTAAQDVADVNVQVTSNDANENPFVFTARAVTYPAIAALLLLQPENAAVFENGTVDFIPPVAGQTITRIMTIQNTGTVNLTIQSITLGTEGNPEDFAIGAVGTTTVAPAAATTFPVTFTPGGNGTRTAKLRIASNDSDDPLLEVNLTARTGTASERWRSLYFNASTNSGRAADLSDPDNDRIPNILEFATLTDPLTSNTFPAALVKNGGVLEYTFARSKAAMEDLDYALEWSDSPGAAPWSVAGVSSTILSETAVQQQVRFSVAAGDGRRFVRLRVTRK